MAKLESKIYDKSGKESGVIKLPESVFGLGFNSDLVHQVIVGMESNARSNTAHTKDRSEVRGGGRKPWRQKGTGSARHGSRRSPIWVGGGVTFGPRNERNYTKKINKKMRAKALFYGLSKKFDDGQILFTENVLIETPNTKEANNFLLALEKVEGFETLNTKNPNNILLVLTGDSEAIENTKKSFRNIKQVNIVEARNLNIVDLAKYRYAVITDAKNSVEVFESKLQVEAKTSDKKDEKLEEKASTKSEK